MEYVVRQFNEASFCKMWNPHVTVNAVYDILVHGSEFTMTKLSSKLGYPPCTDGGVIETEVDDLKLRVAIKDTDLLSICGVARAICQNDDMIPGYNVKWFWRYVSLLDIFSSTDQVVSVLRSQTNNGTIEDIQYTIAQFECWRTLAYTDTSRNGTDVTSFINDALEVLHELFRKNASH